MVKLNYSLSDSSGRGQRGVAHDAPSAFPYGTTRNCHPLTPIQKSVDSPP